VEEFPADAEFFNSMDAPELAEWEESFLSGSDSLKKCKSIIELLQDWYERFGKSSDFYASFLTDSRIVAATCVGIGLKAYRDVDFDLCVVDEASKATPTESLLPISRSRKWVLVGDPAQLPPFIAQAAMDDSLLDKHGLSKDDLRTTLLDRLMDKLPEEAIKSLDTQYRMCPEIGNLISNCFYKGGLRTGRGAGFDFRKHLCIPKPVTWYCTSGCSNKFERKDGKSYQNRKEVYEISILLRRFNFAASVAGVRFSVALLSFYAAQVSALRREAATLSIECPNLSIVVDTVDAFQGRESDVCIVSVTRCNRSNEFGFINDANRVNVALSRGKEALVIVGDSRFCGDSGIDSPLSNVANYIVGNSNECALEYLE
jgi:superfamily I DNA and/or RNA helicase